MWIQYEDINQAQNSLLFNNRIIVNMTDNTNNLLAQSLIEELSKVKEQDETFGMGSRRTNKKAHISSSSDTDSLLQTNAVIIPMASESTQEAPSKTLVKSITSPKQQDPLDMAFNQNSDQPSPRRPARLSKHYRKSLLIESERARIRQNTRKEKNSQSGMSSITSSFLTDSRSGSLLRTEIVSIQKNLKSKSSVQARAVSGTFPLLQKRELQAELDQSNKSKNHSTVKLDAEVPNDEIPPRWRQSQLILEESGEDHSKTAIKQESTLLFSDQESGIVQETKMHTNESNTAKLVRVGSFTSNETNLKTTALIPSQNNAQGYTKLVKTKLTGSMVEARLNKIAHFVNCDDIDQYRFMGVTREEVMSLRFNYDMNLLQLICFEEALRILKFIVQQFENQMPLKQIMVHHQEKMMGSQAIHIAAATGNRELIEILMKEFLADPREKTRGQQTVMHCAAQRYEGVLSIFMFKKCHGIKVTSVDRKGATPLHFAVFNKNIKNVQALLKLNADPNSQDVDGNTPLHVCILTLQEDPESFNELKDIGKELLFSGASRDCTNNADKTPLDLLLDCQDLLETPDFVKMRYVLTPPQGISWLKLSRPIEKVEKSASLQICVLVWDLFNLALFILASSINQKLKDSTNTTLNTVSVVMSAVSFGLSIFFYCLTLTNPGYVRKQRDFMGLLERIINENFHLDYICIHCENLRPEVAMHCNFCNRCVQKFDHHCAFVNNCIGYKNHKYFLLFLLFFLLWLVGLSCHSVLNLIELMVSNPFEYYSRSAVLVFNIILDCYLLVVVLLHCPMICLQLYSQSKKLCRRTVYTVKIEGDAIQKYKDEMGDLSSEFDEDEAFVQMRPPRGCGCCFNLRTIFGFRPQSQRYLYTQLFGEDPLENQERLTVTERHLRIVEETREELETSRWQPSSHGHDTMSASNPLVMTNKNLNTDNEQSEHSIISEGLEDLEYLAKSDAKDKKFATAVTMSLQEPSFKGYGLLNKNQVLPKMSSNSIKESRNVKTEKQLLQESLINNSNLQSACRNSQIGDNSEQNSKDILNDQIRLSL